MIYKQILEYENLRSKERVRDLAKFEASEDTTRLQHTVGLF